MQEPGLGATSLLAALQLCESRHPGSIVVRRGRSGRTTISVCNELLDSIETQKHCYMKGHNRLRDLLINTRPHWDRDGTRPAVRSAFAKALRCQTPELGAEVFASEHEEQVFCHTGKSRPCSSCAYRATV